MPTAQVRSLVVGDGGEGARWGTWGGRGDELGAAQLEDERLRDLAVGSLEAFSDG